VIAALLLAAAPPDGLTLQEALNLPPDSLIVRVLGPSESRFSGGAPALSGRFAGEDWL
jgi:hypothetical protein